MRRLWVFRRGRNIFWTTILCSLPVFPSASWPSSSKPQGGLSAEQKPFPAPWLHHKDENKEWEDPLPSIWLTVPEMQVHGKRIWGRGKIREHWHWQEKWTLNPFLLLDTKLSPREFQNPSSSQGAKTRRACALCPQTAVGGHRLPETSAIGNVYTGTPPSGNDFPGNCLLLDPAYGGAPESWLSGRK
jgi:hypothetical protein